MAICTPAKCASATSAATDCSTAGSMPEPMLPCSASPDTLSMTRLYLALVASVSFIAWLTRLSLLLSCSIGSRPLAALNSRSRLLWLATATCRLLHP
jgi:hypothetical protein